MANLSEAEIDGKHGLREAVVEFAAEAAALFILKIEEARREAMDGLLGVFHGGDVGVRADQADEIPIGIELRDDVAVGPENFGGAGITIAREGIVDGSAGTDNADDGTVLVRNVVAKFIDDGDAELGETSANGRSIGKMKHLMGGTIGEFDAGVGGMQDDREMKIGDEGAETLFAGTEDIFGDFAFGDITNDHQGAELSLDVDD